MCKLTHIEGEGCRCDLHHQVWDLKGGLGDLRQHEWLYPQVGLVRVRVITQLEVKTHKSLLVDLFDHDPVLNRTGTLPDFHSHVQTDGRRVGAPCTTKSEVYRSSWVVNVISGHRGVKKWTT